MKRLLLTSASLLALMAAAPMASATTFLFSGAIVDFTVPVAATYQITAFGAQGGGAGSPGSGGAEIRGDFNFSAGYRLQIAVGGVGGVGKGSVVGGGGGGGSFVIGLPGNHPLLIAGGGGGAGSGKGKGTSGYGGQTTADGADGVGESIRKGSGGSDGSGGGSGSPYGGGGGGGFAGSGSSGLGEYGNGGGGGILGLNGGAGGVNPIEGLFVGGSGGFGGGGGGGGGFRYNAGGGGGGGYSGGGGGGSGTYFGYYYGGGGGGGGSFDGGTKQLLIADTRAGDGAVIITELSALGAPVPEPSTWAMMAAGFAALGLIGLRRRRRA
ncbi:MAG TPA: PEP-CTERM sorting domain-containing protein [Roseiarcus sp.]|jgi:hypothetical protein|nr:PEP-CTERM sorting domain-containing protein [Roseiarcus sp.]